jgi:Uma2 family endonuclease
MNTRISKQILAMPNALIFLADLQTLLEKERAKRLHFYEVIDENKKMEFINGEIIFHSPVMMRHNTTTLLLATLVNTFAELTNQGFVGIEKVMISLTRNDYEPDICYFREEIAKTFSETTMQFPAPDWIVEVLSKSTEKNDRTIKFFDYAAHGVREYWIIDPNAKTIEQYHLKKGQYELVQKVKDGTISCIAMKGFSIPVRAVFYRKENIAALAELTKLHAKKLPSKRKKPA